VGSNTGNPGAVVLRKGGGLIIYNTATAVGAQLSSDELSLGKGSSTTTLNSGGLNFVKKTGFDAGVFSIDNTGVTSASGTLSVFGLSQFSSGFIANASSSVGSRLQVAGALNASSTLLVSGVATFNSLATFGSSGTGLAVTNNATVGGTVAITGVSTLTGGFVSFASSSIADGLQVAGNLSASSTLTLASGFYQSGFSSGCTGGAGEKVLYNATTGQFTCGTDQTGATAFNGQLSVPLYVTNGTNTSTVKADGIYIATSTGNILGLFNVDSSGNVSASGSIRSFSVLDTGVSGSTSTIRGGATSTLSGGLSLSSGNVNLASGGIYLINNAPILSATTLGSSVVNSSLTSVGALDSGSITSNFGAINIGSDSLTAGAGSLSSLAVSGLSSFTGGFISNASSSVAAGLQVAGNLSASSTLTVDGAATFNGVGTFGAAGTGLSVTNDASIGGNLTVGGRIALGQVSSTQESVLGPLYVGRTATTTINGDNTTSTFAGGLSISSGNI
jgi:hypothetical protein